LTKTGTRVKNGWAITKEIFNYIGSPTVKVSQKVFWGRGGYFLTHTVCLHY